LVFAALGTGSDFGPVLKFEARDTPIDHMKSSPVAAQKALRCGEPMCKRLDYH
jgi:hypothetical protein